MLAECRASCTRKYGLFIIIQQSCYLGGPMVAERSAASLVELTKEILNCSLQLISDGLFLFVPFSAVDGGQIVSTRQLLYCQCMTYDASCIKLIDDDGAGTRCGAVSIDLIQTECGNRMDERSVCWSSSTSRKRKIEQRAGTGQVTRLGLHMKTGEGSAARGAGVAHYNKRLSSCQQWHTASQSAH
jgi:hypothetical protein